MPYNEKLADRIREAIGGMGAIEEKKMFRGMCFMLNGKMCICVNEEEILCRVGPEEYEKALEKNGCRPMVHNGKTMTGFVFVDAEAVKSKEDFDYWVRASLAFNKDAKASKPKTRAAAKSKPAAKTGKKLTKK